MVTLIFTVFIIFCCLTGCSTDSTTQEKQSSGRTSSSMQFSEPPRTSSLSLKMIQVPAGSFQKDEKPENISSVTAFEISQYEITRQQFTEVTKLVDPSLSEYSHGPSDPVQSVFWYHTLVFCNSLSLQEGLSPVYTIRNTVNPADWGMVPEQDDAVWDQVTADWKADGYRLPTEMEWLWAAMGANKSAPNQINKTGYQKNFAGAADGYHIDDYAWYGEGRNGTSRPVGSKLPNELALYDMTGNVWEWVWDRFADLPDGHLTDYTGPLNGAERVLKGGSWLNPVERQRLVFRYRHTGGYKWHNMGFRVVKAEAPGSF